MLNEYRQAMERLEVQLRKTSDPHERYIIEGAMDIIEDADYSMRMIRKKKKQKRKKK